MKYAYYPGCSLECNAAAYDDSVREVADLLGIKLQELDDWNCCGATEYFSQDELTACAVIARNLALVDPQIKQLVAPCAACYLNLKKTDRLMADIPEMDAKVNQCLAAGGLNYKPGRVIVRHMLDVIHDDIGETAVRDKVVRPLTGLRVAPYYGCQVVRPIEAGDSTEYPMKMDHLLELAGGRGGRLSGQGPLLRRPHDADQRAAGVRADSPAAAKRPGLPGRHDPLHVSDVPVEHGRLPGPGERLFRHQFQLPIMYFTQIAGHRLRHRAEEARLRQGAGGRHAGVEGETERTIGGSGRQKAPRTAVPGKDGERAVTVVR